MKNLKTLHGTTAVLISLLGCIYCGSGGQRVTSVAVSPGAATVTSVMGTIQFTAMGTFSNNMKQMLTSSNGLTFMSSNTTIATINSSGMAQCLMAGGGPVTITASIPIAMGSTSMMMGSTAMIQGTAVLTCM